MLNTGLYALVVLIWGSTWLAIKFQIGVVPPVESVFYRFLIAAVLLQGFRMLRRPSVRFDGGMHLLFVTLGICLFSLNYVLFYMAAGLGLTSGLEAVIFSFLIFANIFNGWVLFGERPKASVILGAIFGLSGVALLFHSEIGEVFAGTAIGRAILLSAIATFLASLGNMVSRRLQSRGVTVLTANAWGMSYGAALLFVGALTTQSSFVFDMRASYVISLLVLSILGSIIAFGAYLTLLGRIGASRASYATIMFPIVALILSSVFENYRWSALEIAGMGLIIAGNLVVLSKKLRRTPRQNLLGQKVA